MVLFSWKLQVFGKYLTGLLLAASSCIKTVQKHSPDCGTAYHWTWIATLKSTYKNTCQFSCLETQKYLLFDKDDRRMVKNWQRVKDYQIWPEFSAHTQACQGMPPPVCFFVFTFSTHAWLDLAQLGTNLPTSLWFWTAICKQTVTWGSTRICTSLVWRLKLWVLTKDFSVGQPAVTFLGCFVYFSTKESNWKEEIWHNCSSFREDDAKCTLF